MVPRIINYLTLLLILLCMSSCDFQLFGEQFSHQVYRKDGDLEFCNGKRVSIPEVDEDSKDRDEQLKDKYFDMLIEYNRHEIMLNKKRKKFEHYKKHSNYPVRLAAWEEQLAYDGLIDNPLAEVMELDCKAKWYDFKLQENDNIRIMILDEVVEAQKAYDDAVNECTYSNKPNAKEYDKLELWKKCRVTTYDKQKESVHRMWRVEKDVERLLVHLVRRNKLKTKSHVSN